MTISIEQLNKEISSEINRLPEGEMGEVIIDNEFFENIPEPEAFLEPPPDVILELPDNVNDEWWVDWWRKCPPEYQLLLGVYIPMRSPGQVVLFGDNLKLFYKSLVQSLRHQVPYMTKLDLSAAWTLVLMKTHEHELFHYNVNVLQELFGGSYTPLIEEALAVAWARLKIQEQRSKWQSAIGRMNGMLYSLLMRMAFDYRSPGYRDWILYADEVRFKPALLKYISPGNHARLQTNGVDMEQLLYGMIGRIEKGYVEKVW